MLKKVTLVLLVLFALGCSPNFDEFDSQVIDIKSKPTIILKARSNQQSIHTIRIYFKGYLNGNGRVSIDEISKSKEISGDVSLNFSNEWYGTECLIEYSR